MRQISTGPHYVVILITSLCHFVFDYNLSQVIQIPTHTGGNILDIVLTNTPEAVFNVNVAPFSPLRSDHFAVTFRLSYYVPVTSSSSAKSLFDYSKADWTGLLEYLLNYDFDLLFHDDDNDIVWESFKDLFLSSLHMYVPVVVSRSAANYTPWFNGLSIIILNAYGISRGVMRLTPPYAATEVA